MVHCYGNQIKYLKYIHFLIDLFKLVILKLITATENISVKQNNVYLKYFNA